MTNALISAIRILVVDDHDIIRRAVCTMLRLMPQFDVVGDVSDGKQAIEKAKELQPDVVIMDVTMPVMNGIEAARQIPQVAANSKILFLSQHDAASGMRLAFATGALGYVLKSDAATDLVSAVFAVSQGRKFLSRSLEGGSSGGGATPPLQAFS